MEPDKQVFNIQPPRPHSFVPDEYRWASRSRRAQGFLRCIYRQGNGNHCFAFPAGLRMEERKRDQEEKRRSEVLVFLPLRPGPPFVPSDPLVGERIEGLLGLSPSIRAISPFPVERHPSNATGSNCFTSPSTAGVASKGKLFISSNTCGSISPAIRGNYWIWASSSASKPVEAKVQSNKLSLLTLHLHIYPFLHLLASL
ncbi:hypothetical protein QYF36_013537 [Acer negundo]|nr:hypothetical protein QYF36_013537 [Acer negundo]